MLTKKLNMDFLKYYNFFNSMLFLVSWIWFSLIRNISCPLQRQKQTNNLLNVTFKKVHLKVHLPVQTKLIIFSRCPS